MITDASVSVCPTTHQRQQQGMRIDADLEIRRLINGDELQALCYLNQQPLKNVIMIGLIRDHGLDSPRNRGNFYGCFFQHKLVGMALIGHCILVSGSRETIKHFAPLACLTDKPEVRLLLGEAKVAESFRRYLGRPSGQLTVNQKLTVNQTVAQLMLVLTDVKVTSHKVRGLRQARANEMDEVARMNAGAYVELNGVDPASQDPKGFRERVLSRIEMGRVWVVNDEAGIAFKLDIVSVTDEALYLEGIITRPDLRGTGLGSAALSELCRQMLHQHKAICLFADAANQSLLSFYRRIGFTPFASYRLIRFAG